MAAAFFHRNLIMSWSTKKAFNETIVHIESIAKSLRSITSLENSKDLLSIKASHLEAVRDVLEELSKEEVDEHWVIHLRNSLDKFGNGCP